MEDRLAEILHATVREYIRNGEPVSSLRLYEDYDFGIKPARIRAILNELTDAELLFQPHVSGGRVPTDRALEVFVAEALRGLGRAHAPWRFEEALAEEFRRGALEDMVHTMSEELELLGAGYATKLKNLYTSGLDELIEHIEFNDRGELREIIKDFEGLGGRIEKWLENERKSPEEVQVFVGKKSPLTKSPHLAVMTELVGEGDDAMLLVAIGSRRMNYEKGLKFFKSIEELLRS